MTFWKRLRVLVTNQCNYQCSFCHNEGQGKSINTKPIFMKYNELKAIIDSLRDTELKEVQFSGGEPFLNPAIIDMITYVDRTTDFEIGCATNASILSLDLIRSLSKTKVKLNVQFPSTDTVEYRIITATGNMTKLLDTLDLCKEYGVPIGLNHVLSGTNHHDILKVINWARQHSTPIKILPDINETANQSIKEYVIRILRSILFEEKNLMNGSIKWKLPTSGSNFVTATYVDSPCFSQDKPTCINYAEIRLHPDLHLQSCIKDFSLHEFGFSLSSDNSTRIKTRFQELWNNFSGN